MLYCRLCCIIVIMEREVSLLEPPPPEPTDPRPVCGFLPPANPIITKDIHQQQRATLRIDPLAPPHPQQHSSRQTVRPLSEQRESQEASQAAGERRRKEGTWKPYMEVMTLANGYQPDSLIFKRYLNGSLNRRGKQQFFSSLFVGLQGNRGQRLPQYKGMLRDDDLIFDSNFESGNLMAVFKIEDRVYDLVLQNDLNTRGFTQWYNFRVTNRRNNFVAKFNIVNLYKSKSLYSIGMKPIVRSERSDRNVKKTWRRKGFNIYYDKNELSYEDNSKKCYKTLSFEYDFTIEDDTVQFAHGMPYDLSDLQRLLSHLKTHPKVKISSIGNTLMGRPIPLIKIAAVEEAGRMEKKALVILARQHPGETPGSFIAEEMVMELLRNSTESDFLGWRFDIFIFPMVNQDGVQLGNYRSNFAGFDLNRCWLRPDSVKQPEVVAIKNYIRKLQKKYKIELVLDLHGHSRKMGSFFYGNNFGTNFMLFPYIASRGNRNILFEKSSFSHETETDSKGSTARVVLGNMLRESGGYVYTYEVSFFGNYKENHHTPFAFQEEHYKELAHTLVQSVYKTYLELYKEEKTLKESHFLKSTKTELHQIAAIRKIDDEEASGSDSEAEEEMEQEVEQIEQFFQEGKYMEEFSPPPIQIAKRPSAYQGVDREISISKRVKELRDLGEPEEHNEEVKQKIQELLEKNLNDDLREVILQRLPSIRRENQRQSTFNELKREIAASSEFRIGEEADGREAMSVEASKGKKYGLPQHLRVKKYKNYFDWLKVSGETFALQDRERRQMAQQQQQKNFPQEAQKKTVQHIKQNLLLINHASKSTDSRAKKSKQLTTINILDNLDKQEKMEELPHQAPLGINPSKQSARPTFKEFPSAAALDNATTGPFHVNRMDHQRQQNRMRRLQATPSKEMKKEEALGRLPPI